MKQAASLYEKSPETRRLLGQIPRRLRLLAAWSFAGIVAGIALLAAGLRFPESTSCEAYVRYEGVRQDARVFRLLGGGRSVFPSGCRRADVRLLDPNSGDVITIQGSAVFCPPDTLLLTSSADSVLSIAPSGFSARIDVYTDTIPLWKKILLRR